MMRLYADNAVTWEIVKWPGRRYVRICCPRYCLLNEGQHDEGCPGGGIVSAAEPDEYVRVLRDHDLGDCDESYRRMV